MEKESVCVLWTLSEPYLMVDATVEEQLQSETCAGVRIKDCPLTPSASARFCLAQHSSAPQSPSASPGMQ